MECWEAGADGLPHLKARVRAIPEDGKANAALIALLAKTLRVPRSSLTLASGSTGRLKRIEIAGDGVRLSAALEALGEAT